MHKEIDVFGYAFGNAANNHDCEKGPGVLKKALEKTGNPFHWSAFHAETPRFQQAALGDVIALNTQLANSVQKSLADHHFFITLGGDHTAAIGSWSGAASVFKKIGLIWFDAHMDSHTPATTLTNNIHGMPLAVLLGHGEPGLTNIATPGAKLKPENVVLIGTRSFEAGEADLLKKLNVTIFDMDDVKKMGLKKVIQEAIKIATHHTEGFGISIDLDGFDPSDAPGVGVPEKNGIHARDFLSEFHVISHHPKLIGADIVEFNPVLDVDHKTQKLAIELISKLMKR